MIINDYLRKQIEIINNKLTFTRILELIYENSCISANIILIMKVIYVVFVVSLFLMGVFCKKDMMRKSIVFDKNTPDVFYCPIHKPTGFDKLIVK